MPDPTGGITAGSIGALGSIGGSLLSAHGASKAAEEAAEAQWASLMFEKQRYADWKATYGAIEDNLADYYEKLTPDSYITKNFEAYQKEYDQAKTALRESLEQRGIRSDSGVAAASDLALTQDKIQQRAAIRAQAPQAVTDMKQSFLNLGLGQNPANKVSTALSNIATSAATRADSAAQAAGSAIGTAVKDTATALGDYVRSYKDPYLLYKDD